MFWSRNKVNFQIRINLEAKQTSLLIAFLQWVSISSVIQSMNVFYLPCNNKIILKSNFWCEYVSGFAQA